jgi:hypothetical protein
LKPRSRIGVVFPFNEVNAAVFQNAGLFWAKRKYGCETEVFAPEQFRGLYFSVDKFNTITKLPYSNYGEVAKWEPNEISKKKLKTWFTPGALNFIKHRSLNYLPASVFHSIPLELRSDWKTTKYLVRSGIYSKCKSSFANSNHMYDYNLFFGDGAYTNLATLKQEKKDLQNCFQYQFTNLYNLILTGEINFMTSNNNDSINELESPSEIQIAMDFISARKNVIFLRTRNYDNSVRFQNAPVKDLAKLINLLLNEGVSVINSGVPASNLGISHENYLEYSHNLSISREMQIASMATFIMQTAWAGLFTAFATLNKNLITFQNEWSVHNLIKPISLLEAREKIGIKDIPLGDNFASDKLNLSISMDKIMSSF